MTRQSAQERLYNERFNEEDERQEREKNRYKNITETKRGQAREIDIIERW